MGHHSSDVSNNRFCSHRAIGNNLRDLVSSIVIDNVLDHFIASIHTEIDIKIGHGDTFRIQKPFEQQFVFEWIQVGDIERVSHQGTCTGATARAHRYIVFFGPVDEIHDDQKITGIPHLNDDTEFEIKPVQIGFAIDRLALDTLFLQKCQASLQSLLRDKTEKTIGSMPLGYWIFG